jgi:nicotinic acid mononucleotide adenylyltransferase
MAPTSAAALSAAERRRLAPLAAALARARQGQAGAAGAGGAPRLEPVLGTLAPGRRRGGGTSGPRAGLLAGSFNPLTKAHAALAVAGHRAGCDPVVLAMAPVSLAKERVERAHPLDRLDWVCRWARRHPWAVVAVASHPLLVDQAEALRDALGSAVPVALLLGTDKAVQLTEPHWYDDPAAALARLAQAATLLVAERAGHPREAATAALPLPVTTLRLPPWAPERSSTEARTAATAGQPLTGLVPASIIPAIIRSHAYDPDPAAYTTRAAMLDALLPAIP